jgi:hypothetical protein
MLHEMHEGFGGGHFSFEITIHKIVDANYWWPTMHKYAFQYCQACDNYQQTKNLIYSNITKLVISLPLESFMKWGLDFVSPIKIVSIYIGSNWLCHQVGKKKALHTNITAVITKFIYEFIFTRFGYSLILINVQGIHFINNTIEIFTHRFLLQHTTLTTYYL